NHATGPALRQNPTTSSAVVIASSIAGVRASMRHRPSARRHGAPRRGHRARTAHHGDGSAGRLTDDATLVLRFRLALLLPALAEDAPAGGGRPGRSRADRVRRGAVRAWRTGPGRDPAQARVHLPPGAVAG